MTKYTADVKQNIKITVTTAGFKEGETVNVEIKLFNKEKNTLAQTKNEKASVSNNQAVYIFSIEQLAKDLKVDLCEAKYVYLWIDGDNDTKNDTNEEFEIEVKYSVAHIPNTMRNKLNWPKSADLMDLWFNKSAKVMTVAEKGGIAPSTYDIYDKNYVNTTMFTMDWLLGFDRAKKGFFNLQKTINNPKALAKVEENIRNYIKAHRSSPSSFDPILLHAPLQFQVERIGSIWDDLDDLYGSLGNFALYAAASKFTVVAQSSNKHIVHVTEVAVYMKDTYDFIGEQDLGYWNCDSVSKYPLSGQSIGNSDFNEYRKKSKKGGDLLLFSDVKKIPYSHSFLLEGSPPVSQEDINFLMGP